MCPAARDRCAWGSTAPQDIGSSSESGGTKETGAHACATKPEGADPGAGPTMVDRPTSARTRVAGLSLRNDEMAGGPGSSASTPDASPQLPATEDPAYSARSGVATAARSPSGSIAGSAVEPLCSPLDPLRLGILLLHHHDAHDCNKG